MSAFLKKIFYVIQLSRPINLLISFFSVLGGAFIAWNQKTTFPDEMVLLGATVVLFVTAASNIINDFFDLEIDKINRPNRILPSRKIKQSDALFYYISFVVISIILSFNFPIEIILIVLFSNIILFLYSFKLKKIPVIGNLVVSFFTGFVFVYAALFVGNWQGGIIPFAFAFQINLIREIIKDIQDIKGDKQNKVKTLPIVFGVNFTKRIIPILTIILIASTAVPFYVNQYSINYLIIVFLTTNVFLVKVNFELFRVNTPFKKISLYLKLAMIFGLIAIVVGV